MGNYHYEMAFRELVQDTEQRTGIELPWHISNYIIVLLADRLDSVTFLPRNTYAESLLSIRDRTDAKTLGDNCLWVTGVFPNKSRPPRSYVTDIGRSAYTHCTHSYANRELFEQLSTHFEYIRDFVTHTIRDRV